VGDVGLGDAGAVVGDHDLDVARFGAAGREDDPTAPLADSPLRVEQEVDDDLLELRLVGVEHREIRCHPALDRDPALMELRLHQRGRLLHDRVQVDRREPHTRRLGEVHELPGELGDTVGLR
jgi:hypothetical protein